MIGCCCCDYDGFRLIANLLWQRYQFHGAWTLPFGIEDWNKCFFGISSIKLQCIMILILFFETKCDLNVFFFSFCLICQPLFYEPLNELLSVFFVWVFISIWKVMRANIRKRWIKSNWIQFWLLFWTNHRPIWIIKKMINTIGFALSVHSFSMGNERYSKWWPFWSSWFSYCYPKSSLFNYRYQLNSNVHEIHQENISIWMRRYLTIRLTFDEPILASTKAVLGVVIANKGSFTVQWTKLAQYFKELIGQITHSLNNLVEVLPYRVLKQFNKSTEQRIGNSKK